MQNFVLAFLFGVALAGTEPGPKCPAGIGAEAGASPALVFETKHKFQILVCGFKDTENTGPHLMISEFDVWLKNKKLFEVGAVETYAVSTDPSKDAMLFDHLVHVPRKGPDGKLSLTGMPLTRAVLQCSKDGCAMLKKASCALDLRSVPAIEEGLSNERLRELQEAPDYAFLGEEWVMAKLQLLALKGSSDAIKAIEAAQNGGGADGGLAEDLGAAVKILGEARAAGCKLELARMPQPRKASNSRSR